ncbi:hypothetical protein AB1N83_013244, partial [Pleurotus pulmonarius]
LILHPRCQIQNARSSSQEFEYARNPKVQCRAIQPARPFASKCAV